MKLAEAIEINTDLLGEGPTFPPEKRREAVKLGIEALKEVTCLRSTDRTMVRVLLPGETPE